MGKSVSKQRSRAELTEAQAKRKITDNQWQKLIMFLSSGYALQDALDNAKILRAQYHALVITNEEKREQVEIAREEWLRSAWPDDVFAEICERVSLGELAKHVIPDLAPVHLDNPLGSFYRVKNIDPIFKEMWTDARQTAMELMSDECIEIVDDNSNDVIQGTDKYGNEVEISNPSAVRRAEARVKARQWQMERLFSKQFGTKIQQEVEVSVKDPAEELAQARKRKAEKSKAYRDRLVKDVGRIVSEQ